MTNKVEIRFRMSRGPFNIVAAAANMRGMTVTSFVQHAIVNELKAGGDYTRFVPEAVTTGIYDKVRNTAIEAASD